MENTERINTEIVRLNGEISLLVETEKDAEYELIERPNDSEMHEMLKGLAQDIGERKRKISRLQAALVEAESRDQKAYEDAEEERKCQSGRSQ